VTVDGDELAGTVDVSRVNVRRILMPTKLNYKSGMSHRLGPGKLAPRLDWAIEFTNTRGKRHDILWWSDEIVPERIGCGMIHV